MNSTFLLAFSFIISFFANTLGHLPRMELRQSPPLGRAGHGSLERPDTPWDRQESTRLNGDIHTFPYYGEETKPPLVIPPPKPLPIPKTKPKHPIPNSVKSPMERIVYTTSGESFERFGHDIAADGEILAVSTSAYDPASDKVYIFCDKSYTNSETSDSAVVADWVELGSIPATSDYTFTALAVEEDYLFLGMQPYTTTTESLGGKVLAVRKTEAGCSSVADIYAIDHAQELLSPNSTLMDHFGSTIAAENNVVVIGSFGYSEIQPNQGIVWIFAMDADSQQ